MKTGSNLFWILAMLPFLSKATMQDPILDDYNVYKYLKDPAFQCVAGHKDCIDGITGRTVLQYSPRNGYHGLLYGLNGSLGVNTFTRNQIGFDIDPKPNPSKPGKQASIISKYSGNLATYTAKHYPVAVAHENFTYFVYSGSVPLNDDHSIVASTGGNGLKTTAPNFERPDGNANVIATYLGRYNHATETVEKPIVIHVKATDDPHDNAVVNIGGDGHVYVFLAGRGAKRGAFMYRSIVPANSSIPLSRFRFNDLRLQNVDYSGCFSKARNNQQNTETTGCGLPHGSTAFRGMSYPKLFWMEDHFRIIYTVYCVGHKRDVTCTNIGSRQLYTAKLEVDAGNPVSGVAPSVTVKDIRILASVGGHYAIANQVGNKIAVAFNYHKRGHPNDRVNLYAILFDGDDGKWKAWRAGGSNPREITSLPITSTLELSKVAVKEYNEVRAGLERGIYLKDITLRGGKPLILYVGVTGGSNNYNPHIPNTSYDHYLAQAYFDGNSWINKRISNAVDHNYSTGGLYNMADGDLGVIFPYTPENKNNALAGGMMVTTAITPGVEGHHALTYLTGNNQATPGVAGYTDGLCEYNYARTVFNANADGKFVAIFSGGNPYQYENTGTIPHAPIFVVTNGGTGSKRLPMQMASSTAGLDNTWACTP